MSQVNPDPSCWKPQAEVNLSVVVAAYNEEPVIAENIRRIVATLEERGPGGWELVLVNDGSRDETGAIIDQASGDDGRLVALHHRRNFGQGRALRTGFEVCRGAFVVTLDADLSYGPEFIWLLYDALLRERVEIALASAYMKGGEVRNVPWCRLILSKAANRYLARMSQYDIAVISCVVRAYRREVLDSLFLTSDGMELQLEVLMKASLLGFKVCEIPAALVWPEQPPQGKPKRTSKMRILHSSAIYLKMGWLSRPSFALFILASILVLPGLYMAAWIGINFIEAMGRRLADGDSIRWAISHGLEDVFSAWSYSFFISGGLLIIGLLIFIMALLVMQNKFYFDEVYRLNQHILTRDRRRREPGPRS